MTASATSGLERTSPSATATATATLATSATDDETMPLTTWSTELMIVRSVSDEFRSSREQVRRSRVADQEA